MYYETAIGGGTSAPAINNGEIRLYQNSSGTGGGTITISAVEGLELVSVEIGSSMATSIAYTLNGSTDKSETESLAADGTFLVSDINAQSVTFYCMGKEKSARLYVNYLKATYKPIVSTQVIKPVLSPEDGTTFTESLTVTASCATEGAIIYYTTNGNTPTTESEVLTADGVTINETTTIKAMAVMADGFLDPSTFVEATYTKVVPIANLAELKTQELGEYTVRLNNAVVTYAEARKAYIQDESAGLYIYGDNTLKAGTSLNGIVTAELDLYDGLYELKVYGGEFDNVDVTEGVEIPVTTVTLEELAANFAQYESMRDGAIQRFEFCAELAWKAAQDCMQAQGYLDVHSPKAVMRKAYAEHLITDEPGWLALLNARNQASHLYDDAVADAVYQAIGNTYLPLLRALSEKLSAAV